ncbi:Uncharacterised protein [Bordetella pertussis]|nr:Uncharacterised protein [Bordetella pertussis]CFP65593.1 Uncharacterised protein [Bordetella pertussis]
MSPVTYSFQPAYSRSTSSTVVVADHDSLRSPGRLPMQIQLIFRPPET